MGKEKPTPYTIIMTNKENIYSVFKLDPKNKELDIYFDSFARGFNGYVATAKCISFELGHNEIASYFVSSFIPKMRVTTCNPIMLKSVCGLLSLELKKLHQ